jgi:Protein of unknown function (DUF3828)
MISRRAFVFSGIAALACAASHPAIAADDPVAILNAIYARVAAGKGDGGGAFVFENKAAKAKYLSMPLVQLWARADAATPKGDVGPVDFDPLTNSQDPDVKSFKVAAEKLEESKATVAVILAGHNRAPKKASDQIIRFDFQRQANGWKIDDIKGTVDGKPWSVRAMLLASLKH